MTEEQKMKPIWYFVGLILLVMGVIILFTGIYEMFNPPAVTKILANTHPGIWWGAIMVVFGGVMFLTNINKSV
jgi:di/tricarboxylate transporter